jgi:hypothetical protein
MGSWHSGSTWKAWAYSRGRSRSTTWWDDGFCGSEGVRSMHRSVSGCCSLQVVWSKLHHHHICFLVGWYLIGLSIYLSSSHSNLFFPSLDHHFPFISFVWGNKLSSFMLVKLHRAKDKKRKLVLGDDIASTSSETLCYRPLEFRLNWLVHGSPFYLDIHSERASALLEFELVNS